MLKSDTTLTKGQVARLQEQLREEQDFRLNDQANHEKDIARLEEQIIKAIEGAGSLEKAKVAISVNLMQARASSARTTAEIRAGMAQLGKKKQRPTVVACHVPSLDDDKARATGHGSSFDDKSPVIMPAATSIAKLPTVAIGKQDLSLESHSIQDLDALVDAELLWDVRGEGTETRQRERG